MFLCVSLLAWRLGARVEQYRPAGADRSATVNFFDANESNIALIDAAGCPSACEDARVWLFRAVPVEAPAWPARWSEHDTGPAFSSLGVQPIALFSNPPPSSRA